MQEAGTVKKDPEVWLIFGWKVGQAGLRKAVTDLPPEEMGSTEGLRVIVAMDGKEAILGKVVASGPFTNGIANLGMFTSDNDALERLRFAKRVKELGLGDCVSGEPSYWFAGG